MPNGFQIKSFKFDVPRKQVVGLEVHPLSRDWPVVYLIHNSSDLYIGETSSALMRMSQHLDNSERKKLDKVEIIFDKEYNKSAILDIEQSLIHLYSVDGKFHLQNRNAGQSKKHNYYQREKYLNKVEEIWQQLHAMEMTSKSILDIRNSDMYKYSPYHSLTEEQNELCSATMHDILNHLLEDKQSLTIVQGTAGTGKSVVLMNMLFQLVNANSFNVDFSEEDDELHDYQLIQHKVTEYLKQTGKKELKVAYVIAMTSFRATIKEVFSLTKNGLKSNMVIGPSNMEADDVKDKYDIVFIDEAHRLAQRKNISYMGAFDNKCREIFGDDCDPRNYTQLDWILACSKNVVLVYDQDQRVAGSDITHEQFLHSIEGIDATTRMLGTQMRCLGGAEFADYVKSVLDCSCTEKKEVENYDFKLYSHAATMIRDIKAKEDEYKLCRVAAGYAWKWESKGINSPEEVIKQGKEDIEIEGQKYIWNMSAQGWILEPNAINEIGCIHTTQGYDLNYVGLIFGREIDYNPETGEITIDKNLFFDSKAKNGCDSHEALKRYIINAYRTMMLRGIRGCYVYAYNDNLRDYLSKFIELNTEDEEKEQEEPQPEQLIIPLEEGPQIFDEPQPNTLPFYSSVKGVCGVIEEGYDPTLESEGWISSEGWSSGNLFVIRACGDSMEPKISDGDYCVFEVYSGGSRNGEIVLTQCDHMDDDYDCFYTIKKYYSEKVQSEYGEWQHSKVELRSLNPAYPDIILQEDEDRQFRTIGIYKGKL